MDVAVSPTEQHFGWRKWLLSACLLLLSIPGFAQPEATANMA